MCNKPLKEKHLKFPPMIHFGQWIIMKVLLNRNQNFPERAAKTSVLSGGYSCRIACALGTPFEG
jgi:hypothetical protein